MKFSQNIMTTVFSLLKKAGFMPCENFTAVDGLIHKDKSMAYACMKNCGNSGEALSCDGKKYFLELECEFEIRLMGKSGNFCDYAEFDQKCLDFYKLLAEDETILVKTMKMGKVYQSMPLKRLQRDFALTSRILCQEDISQ